MNVQQIKQYRDLYAKNLVHEVPQLRQAALDQIAICDLALCTLLSSSGLGPDTRYEFATGDGKIWLYKAGGWNLIGDQGVALLP